MRTVEKALKLLDLFTSVQPEAGLSALARQAGLDKATALRMLTALAAQGFVEQHPETRRYRLGKAVLKLARLREASFPAMSVIQPALDRLAAGTGETAHGSLASDTALVTVGIAEPQRATRVHVDLSEPLPFHATASGIAYLAFSPPEIVEARLRAGPLAAHTDRTATSLAAVRKQIAAARERGHAIAEGSFEAEVTGIAAPIFDWSGQSCGAVAVAALSARATPDRLDAIAGAVMREAVETSRAMGAEPHPALLRRSGARAA